MGRLRHDQVSLQRISIQRFRICFPLGVLKVSERNRGIVLLIEDSQWSGVAGFVLPGLEVHGLARTDAQQDSQHFEIGYMRSERGIQTGAALLDKRKAESCREGDPLEQIREG